MPRAAVSRHFLSSWMHPVPISRSRGPSAARQWRFARADRAHWGQKERDKENSDRAGGCAIELCASRRGDRAPRRSQPPLLLSPRASPSLPNRKHHRPAAPRSSASAPWPSAPSTSGSTDSRAPRRRSAVLFFRFFPPTSLLRERAERERKKDGEKKKRGPKIPTLARSKRKRKKKPRRTPPNQNRRAPSSTRCAPRPRSSRSP